MLDSQECTKTIKETEMEYVNGEHILINANLEALSLSFFLKIDSSPLYSHLITKNLL